MSEKPAPFLAAASFLCLALAGTQLIQGVGHYLNISLVHASLPCAALLSLAAVYGYFFRFNRQNLAVLTGMLLVLALLGLASIRILDMTSDGLGYQQPAAEAVLNGWNPLRHDARMIWQNIYPSGAWELEASLAALYGSIEAAKMLQIWWLLIAAAILLAGMRHYKAPLTSAQHLLTLLIVLCPVVITEALTHYVDAMLYLAGITFIGALLLTGANRKQDQLAYLLMAAAILFMVNAKLSGVYHAVVLCVAALLFWWMESRKLPVKPALFLMAAGITATLIIGFHPYITNLQTYGSLLHMDAEKFSAYQRPANLTPMLPPQRFIYSVFSFTGDAPRVPAHLKCPWIIYPWEWSKAGMPDARTGGFGVLFALGLIGVTVLTLLAMRNLKQCDGKLFAIAALLFISSMIFPEGWWARYVPFAFTAALLALLALPQQKSWPVRAVYCSVIGIFIINSALAAWSAYVFTHESQTHFEALAAKLRTLPAHSVYLVPPGSDYETYNHSHMPLQRRLSKLGVDTTIKVDDPCPRKIGAISEFKICF